MTRTMHTSDDSFEFDLREPVEEIRASENGFHDQVFGSGGGDNEQPLSLRSPSSGGSAAAAATAAGLSPIAQATAVGGLPPALRDWTERAYSAARQYVGERLGLRTRSSCNELDEQVSRLRRMRNDYSQLLADARQLAVRVGCLLAVQRQLASTFAELSRNSATGVEPACLLRDDFACNHCTQSVLISNGEKLLEELNRFVGSLNTLCNTAMTDTMDTVAVFESSRLEYDARRNEFEAMSALPPTSSGAAARLDEARTTYEAHRLKYEGMCSTLSAKLKFLDDNRLKVMRRDLVLLHNATAAYFSGNKADFNKELSRFNMTLRQPRADGQSWLEK